MTRPATPSPLTRAAEACRRAEIERDLTAVVIAKNVRAGIDSSADLLARFDREDAAVRYARAVQSVEFTKAAREVAA